MGFMKIIARCAMAAAGWASVAGSQALAQATSEKCTCNVSESPGTGARVVNAATCLADIGTPTWCEISVAALLNSPNHQRFSAEVSFSLTEANPELFGSVIQRLIDIHARGLASRTEADLARGGRPLETFLDDAEKIRALLTDASAAFGPCGSAYVAGNIEEDVEVDVDGLLSCKVWRDSGWLGIEVDMGEHQYLFLFAPGPSS